MKCSKRFIIVLMVLTFMFASSMSVFAVSSETDMDYLTNTVSTFLPTLQQESDSMGFSNIDFSNVKIGSEINAYRMGTNSLVPIDYKIYPLISDNRIFAICALIYNSDGSRNVTVAKSYADILNEISGDFSILFTNTCAYAVTETGSYVKIQEFEDQGYATTLTLQSAVAQVSSLCTPVTVQQSIEYLQTASRAGDEYNSLGISYVPQNGEPICWAACMASVVNYFRSTSYTADSMVSYLGQDSDYNYIENIVSWFESYWDFTCGGPIYSVLTYNNIKLYINNDRPVFCGLIKSGADSGHAVVVYGYRHYANTTVNSVLYMDPNIGLTLTSLNASGGFSINYSSGTYIQDRYAYVADLS